MKNHFSPRLNLLWCSRNNQLNICPIHHILELLTATFPLQLLEACKEVTELTVL